MNAYHINAHHIPMQDEALLENLFDCLIDRTPKGYRITIEPYAYPTFVQKYNSYIAVARRHDCCSMIPLWRLETNAELNRKQMAYFH